MFKLRFWWVILKAYFSRGMRLKSHVPFWVTPFDCDINLHCNNASYLKYMDLGRWDLLIRMGLFRALVKARLQPVVVRIEINFKKAMPPFAYFNLETTYESIAIKTMTLKQSFQYHGVTASEALVTVAVLKNGKVVPTEKFLHLLPADLQKLVH